MKEGYIIHVVGKAAQDQSALRSLIEKNNLDLFEYRLSGNQPLPDIYKAYQELQKQQVTAVNCLSVEYSEEAGDYVFLDQSMSLDSFTDISRLCSKQELGTA
jgi:hypothetical protein